MKKLVLALLALVASPLAAQFPDLASSVTGPTIATPGTVVTYVVTFRNKGPESIEYPTFLFGAQAPLEVRSFKQTSGPALRCVQLGPSSYGTSVQCDAPTGSTFPVGVATIDISVLVPLSAARASGMYVSTTAGIGQGGASDPHPENNGMTFLTAVYENIDLTAALTASQSVAAGGLISYTATFANRGTTTVREMTSAIALPPGTTMVVDTTMRAVFSGASGSCTFPSQGAAGSITCVSRDFAAGATGTVYFHLRAPATAAAPLTATATITTTDDYIIEKTPQNNRATASTSIADADLGIAVAADAERVAARAPITYTITVSNNGSKTAENVVVDLAPLAAGSIASMTPSQGTCSPTLPGCTLGSVFTDRPATITVVVNAPATSGVVTLNASVQPPIADSNHDNDSASSSVTVVVPRRRVAR